MPAIYRSRCLQRPRVQPALLRLQHALVGRVGEERLCGAWYSQVHGAGRDERQIALDNTG